MVDCFIMWEMVTSKDKPKCLLLYFGRVESVYFSYMRFV